MKQLLKLFIIITFILPATAQSYIGFNGDTPKTAKDIDPSQAVTPVDPYPEITIGDELNPLSLDQPKQNANIEYKMNPESSQANIQITSIAGEIKKK